MYDVIVIGGGIAGLINAKILSARGWKVRLVEKKEYPFHRVCGEYVSNEVIPFLRSIDCYPGELHPSRITRFQLTSTKGKITEMPLDLGGFGISRHAYDHWLVEIARRNGTEINEKTTAQNVDFNVDHFKVLLNSGDELTSKIVIGAFGKRSNMDKSLGRKFFKKRSPYVGVKYHIKTDLPNDVVALHNFQGGYCGVCKVENEIHNLCYLSLREPFKKLGSIPEMERQILYENPYLEQIFKNSDFLFDKPVVINEISFSPKESVHQHILLSGDAAGMITPLCGNGMAMAIHSAKIGSTLINRFLNKEMDRYHLERRYSEEWKKNLSSRLWAGRKIQKLFGSAIFSNLAVGLMRNSGPASRWIMRQTHGAEF